MGQSNFCGVFAPQMIQIFGTTEMSWAPQKHTEVPWATQIGFREIWWCLMHFCGEYSKIL